MWSPAISPQTLREDLLSQYPVGSPPPGVMSPFYFAWVDSDQTDFDAGTMAVVNETIFDFEIKHEEGQCATLDMTIKNDRVGLLAPGRKVWAWLSYEPPTGSGIIPLFFGVLVGIPTNLFAEKITIKLIARPENYIEARQAVAETLKIVPYYDPIFLTETKRDDPDAILEGWSSLYHVDRTSLVVSASDVLVGEDDTIIFQEDDAFYNNVSMNLDQSPLAQIQIQADVHWTQRYIGYIDGPDVNIQSYTGSTFLSDWPKPGTSLGGGWTVETSFVNDVYKVELTPMCSVSSTWTNDETAVADCDTQAISDSSTWPALLSPGSISAIMTFQSQSGICDPYGDPPDQPPINRPAKIKVTGLTVPLWFLNCSWSFRYEAKRVFSEQLFINVAANTQSILASPTVEQNTELLKISGADVGEPLITYEAWSDFAGMPVPFGQLIYPNDPTTPGGLSYQVNVNVSGGTAGSDEPVFSDIPGTITTDGSVQWASLGENPESTIQQMTFATSYDTGTILLYQDQVFDANIGELVDTGGSGYYVCTEPTATTSAYTEVTYIPAATDSDTPTPEPVTIFIEQFSPTSAMVPIDLPFLGIPIGGSADEVTARSFFPSDRGQQSIQYLIARARARIRMRSRAVKVSWQCPFDNVIGLSCRMNATLYDPRLPGGVATGKIISYSMKAGGDGRLIGTVEVGCAVGYGGSVEADAGVPEYTAASGYCQPGYQRYDGAQSVLDSNTDDISYTPPVFSPFDDGLSFPLYTFPGEGTISGSTVAQAKAINAAFPVQRYLAEINEQFSITAGAAGQPGSSSGSSTGLNSSAAWWIAQQEIYWTAQSLPYVMEETPVSYELLISPVTNGPFAGAYTVDVSPLEIPMGINLEAPSSP